MVADPGALVLFLTDRRLALAIDKLDASEIRLPPHETASSDRSEIVLRKIKLDGKQYDLTIQPDAGTAVGKVAQRT